jgi:hypothetical protein
MKKRPELIMRQQYFELPSNPGWEEEMSLEEAVLVDNVRIVCSMVNAHVADFEAKVAAMKKQNDQTLRDEQLLLEMLSISSAHHGNILLLALKNKCLKVTKLLLDGEYSEIVGEDITYKILDSLGKPVKPLSPNTRNAEGECALHIACELGVASIIDGLLKYKQGWEHPWLSPCSIPSVVTNPNSEDKDKNTPLMIAVMAGHCAIVKKLTTDLKVISTTADANGYAGFTNSFESYTECQIGAGMININQVNFAINNFHLRI